MAYIVLMCHYATIHSLTDKKCNQYNKFEDHKVMHFCVLALLNKKAQLSLTNPRDACEKFARFT